MLPPEEELRLRTVAPGKSPGEKPPYGLASGSSVAPDPISTAPRHDGHKPAVPETSIPQTEHLILLCRSITPPVRSTGSEAHDRCLSDSLLPNDSRGGYYSKTGSDQVHFDLVSAEALALSLGQKGFVGPLATIGLSPGTALDCNDVGSWYDVLWEAGREYQSPNAGPRVPMARPSSRILIPVPWSSLNRVE